MTSDMNIWFECNSCDEGIARVGNSVGCHIKGLGLIILDGKNNKHNVYFFDGLKHNLLSVGRLADMGYLL